VRILRDAAIEIGEVVAMLVHFYNPTSVVLGGQLARTSDDVLAGIRSIVYRRALPLATRSLTIENALHGERGGVVGGIVLASRPRSHPKRSRSRSQIAEPGKREVANGRSRAAAFVDHLNGAGSARAEL